MSVSPYEPSYVIVSPQQQQLPPTSLITTKEATFGAALLVVAIAMGNIDFMIGSLAGLAPKKITENLIAKKIKNVLPLEKIPEKKVTIVAVSILLGLLTSSVPTTLAFYFASDNVIDLKEFVIAKTNPHSSQISDIELNTQFEESEDGDFSLISLK